MSDFVDLTRSFRDPIHGTVRLTNEEVVVVDHQLFRRLNGIRQNGLLYLVFPSATHTRFEHSIGVVHVADAVLRHVLYNSHIAAEKSPPAVGDLTATVGKAVDLNLVPQDELSLLFRITRLAALVHDLGHGPYSHTFDAFAPKRQHVLELATPVLGDWVGQVLKTDPEPDVDFRRMRVTHEQMSSLLFATICVESGFDVTVARDVASVIHGDPQISGTPNLRQYVPLMHDIVASAPADADRMDYLERDSRSAGVNYGLFDRPRVLSSFLVYKEKKGKHQFFRLGVKQSGVRAVENLVQARFEMFAQIYFHKTNRAIHMMLNAIAKRAKQIDLTLFEWDSWRSLVAAYTELSDDSFLRILRGRHESYAANDEDLKRLANAVFDRNLWKRVYDGGPSSAWEIQEMLAGKFDREKLQIDKVDPKATKDLENGAALLHRGRDGIYRAESERNWLNASPIIKALAARSNAMERLYYSGIDSNEFKQLRIEAWKLTSKGVS